MHACLLVLKPQQLRSLPCAAPKPNETATLPAQRRCSLIIQQSFQLLPAVAGSD